jgi:hypothetical protein
MVWHWGSRSNPRGTQPRYSLAVEFQAYPTAHPAAGADSGPSSTETAPIPEAAKEAARRWGRPESYGADTNLYGDTVPVFNSPLSNPLLLPTFESRLQLVGKQILQYRHMYPLNPTMEALARELAGNLPVPDYN